MNFAYLVTFALVPLLFALVIHSHISKALIASGLLWKYLLLVALEAYIIGIAGSTVCQFVLHDSVYVPTELTAINGNGSVSYSSSDISDTTVTLDKNGKYNVKLEMKDGKTVSLYLTGSEYETLKESFLESSGTGRMPKTVYILLSSLVGVVFCTIYLIVIYGRVIKQENTLYNAFKSSKHMSMLYLFLIVVAICIHSYLLSYVVV